MARSTRPAGVDRGGSVDRGENFMGFDTVMETDFE
jgi:hypothetical protein